MQFIILFILFLMAAAFLIGFVPSKTKGYIAIVATILLAVVSSVPAIRVLTGEGFDYTFHGSLAIGEIPISIDPLSAWFILIVNFTFITACVYGTKYMEAYLDKPSNLTLHWICFLLTQTGLIAVTAVQNTIAFLIAWEIMAVSAFFLVIFESHKIKTIRAGINYLIQSHMVILFLTIAFIWVASVTGSFNFNAISTFAKTQKPLYSFILMLLFFIGFGFKAGFIPFHTWLPHAHPAAPSHVSGMMSGVLIKIGIYGILRMILLMNTNYLATGYLILVVSVFTGIYGVMLAIVQHNLKRLLAYHSIENIGIIGIGIGIGCIALDKGNELMAVLGFTGALLHVLNHSLFKSLLFYSAGNLYQASHTMNIEKFGGIIKKMPQTAFLFLIAALAICGLPPFNGFVSEFIIYSGLLKGTLSLSFPYILLPLLSIAGLALIGGLAILCFTKAFGAIFLGNPGEHFKHALKESHWQKLVPMYMIAGLIVWIGIFPQHFFNILSLPVKQFTGFIPNDTPPSDTFEIINKIGYISFGFISLTVLIFFLRKKLSAKQEALEGPTWGCGYVAPNNKMQYTASSFVRSYRKLAEPLLLFKKEKKEIKGIFPEEGRHQIHPLDKIEVFLIDRPLKQYRLFLSKFLFLQNGKLQFYILYGMVFVMLLIGIPFLIYVVKLFIHTLNAL